MSKHSLSIKNSTSVEEEDEEQKYSSRKSRFDDDDLEDDGKEKEQEEDEDDRIMRQSVEWMNSQLDNEKQRLQSQGTKVLPAPVKNTGVVKESKRVVNRVEFNTAFDFDKIQQILVSDPIPCPMRPNHQYVHVVLITGGMPLIFPYLFPHDRMNQLTDWVFINNQFKRSRHKVNRFSRV
eukprot:gb/GECH01003342.1/.p1 GENE.gb/GECH01003342.1/~~gb/GECH01003342.1/.p1  ORF type:complete len:179 (+),score=55.41 gb/GECH01003342.1/:1-537(+)